MQGHRVRHHEGLQDVGLDLLDDQDDDQHDDRLRQTAVQRSNHHRDDTRGQGTQNRHECREERDNTDRDGERHTQEERAERDADRVDGRHLNLRTNVGAEGRPTADRALVDGNARGSGQQAHAPQPDRAPFLQKEEQTEKHRQAGGGQRAHRRRDVESTGRQRLLVRVEPVHHLTAHLVGRLVQHGRVEFERAILQVVVGRDHLDEGAKALCSLHGQLWDLLDELGSCLTQRPGNGEEENEEADGCGQGRGEVQLAPHP